MSRIAVIADFLEERWPSMDLAAEQLAIHLRRIEGVHCDLVRPPLRTAFGRGSPGGLARALGRFVQLPIELIGQRPAADYFHVADHSYGHLALLFPGERVGIYCHDIDAFRALLPGSKAPRARALLSALLLKGLRHARVVFHSTQSVRQEILQHDLVPASRLVQVPLGIAEEFFRVSVSSPSSSRYLLHVGSCTPRKNVDFLLRVFAAAHRRDRSLELVQVGGIWTEAQRTYLERNGLSTSVVQKKGIPRAELATLYAAAIAVLVPSLAEGFGLPVAEAVASGAPVVASDIPVLREVGFDGVRFAPVNNEEEWERAVSEISKSGARVSAAARARVLASYSWDAHARKIALAYGE